MLSVTRSTRSASTAAVELRALVNEAVPTLVAKTLTFTAQRAQKAIVEEMPRVFEGGATRYTLNATRIEPATVQDLSARVAVKDRTAGAGTLPEDYLFPQAFGGPRKEKRFERAMRYAGLLQGSERAVLGDGAPADSYGNLKRAEIQRILTATRSAFGPSLRKTDSAKGKNSGKGNAKKAPYFAARIGKTLGVWKRIGTKGEIEPILVFVTKQPTYRKRLDFEGLARATAEREFEPTFRRLLAAANR